MHEAHRKLLATCSSEFHDTHEAIGIIVERLFPGAQARDEWGLPGWAVPVLHPPDPATWQGTLPHDFLWIAPTEKKAGLTIHIWHPNMPSLLQDESAALKEAGFKPMVGCLQWNRKATMPLEPLERLLSVAKRHL